MSLLFDANNDCDKHARNMDIHYDMTLYQQFFENMLDNQFYDK